MTWKPAVAKASMVATVDRNYNVYFTEDLAALLGGEGAWVECLIDDEQPKKVALRPCDVEPPEQEQSNISYSHFRKMRKTGEWMVFGLKRPALLSGADSHIVVYRQARRVIGVKVEGDMVVFDFSNLSETPDA